MIFRETRTYTCMINLGFLTFIYWLLFFLSFFISYGFAFVYEDWGAVGWIVPLVVLLLLAFLHCICFGFFVLIFYKEFIKKDTNFSLGLIDVMNRSLHFSRIINLLSLVSFLFTSLLCLISPFILQFFISVVICFVFDFFYTKK